MKCKPGDFDCKWLSANGTKCKPDGERSVSLKGYEDCPWPTYKKKAGTPQSCPVGNVKCAFCLEYTKGRKKDVYCEAGKIPILLIKQDVVFIDWQACPYPRTQEAGYKGE